MCSSDLQPQTRGWPDKSPSPPSPRPGGHWRNPRCAPNEASPPIRIRIGVHTGDAIHEADHFFGTTVNYAARVASHALGDEVLVSQLVHDLTAGSGIDFLESRDVELKGLNGSHRLYAVDLAERHP